MKRTSAVKTHVIIAVAVLSVSTLVVVPGQALQAQGGSLQSLRGEVSVPETTQAPALRKQNTSGRLDRAYRQQPPLIPHNIEKYQINLKVNQCMRCHDWPYNVQEGAPKISETHYTNREGIALDHVSSNRWFCTQCHVPQVNARPLVRNDFKSSVELR
jgi:cytochrome c-type protein NapB